MNISVQKLLTKIDEELQQAKTENKLEGLRERVYSIKILCELILDEAEGTAAAALKEAAVYNPVAEQPPLSVPQPKKLELDDEANGDSLFDF